MECPICYLPFNLSANCPLISKCGHSFCTSCCVSMDTQVPPRTTCPTCNKSILPNKFQQLSKNYSLVQLINQEPNPRQPILKPKCETHRKMANFVCEGCSLELCNDCVTNHSRWGHTVSDIDRFLRDLEICEADVKQFVATANEKVRFYQTLIEIKKESMKKEISAKFESLKSPQLQQIKEGSLAKLDEAFKNIDLSKIFDMNIGLGVVKEDIRTCIQKFNNFQSLNPREKVFRTHEFLQKFTATQFKNWISKDYSDLLKQTVDKIQYKMPYPKPFCSFDLDTNSVFDSEKLNSLLDEYANYDLQRIDKSFYYVNKPVIEKSRLELSYPRALRVDDLNANLFTWNSKLITNINNYDYFYILSNISPYFILSSFHSAKQLSFDITGGVENKEVYQKELINTLKYLSTTLETIKIHFESCYEFIDTLCDNFTRFRKLKNLRLSFKDPLPSDLSTKLLRTLAEYGERMERLELIKITTGGELQLTDFFKMLNRDKRLVEFNVNCTTGGYMEPHLPKIMAQYPNLIDLKLDLDWKITQSMVNDFVTMMKKLPLLSALSLKFDFDSELDLEEFFENVIAAPKLQAFGFFLIGDRRNKTLDIDLFERLVKKELKVLKLKLPNQPEDNWIMDYDILMRVSTYFKSCQDFSLDISSKNLFYNFKDFLLLFTGITIQLKLWELNLFDVIPGDVEHFATYFLRELPNSHLKKLSLKFQDPEKIVNTQELMEKLKAVNAAGKIHTDRENNVVTLNIEI